MELDNRGDVLRPGWLHQSNLAVLTTGVSGTGGESDHFLNI